MSSVPPSLPKRVRAVLGRLLRSERGVVTIELAIIVPLILFVMLGFCEIYLYMRANSMVQQAAFTLGDSLGQTPTVIDDASTSNANNLGAMWNAAVMLSAPIALQKSGAVYITSICDGTTTPCGTDKPVQYSMASGVAKIWWQQGAPWNASGLGSHVASGNLLPATWPFRNGDSAIVVEVMYQYDPFAILRQFWGAAPGVQTLYQRIYVLPRSGQPLKLVASS
ncbi:TadE/TadG family type IV pilus assembly protein [Burkholderia sp. PAMC 26561]|uniref:TadE/TadG family type IV pilus assembly protein n=1 Tax=Burkholderia sp. PAMC 26561 TaxID=1795043 RepID=UPI00076B0C5E|nr:TadE/TadG family type IV pilus assembly protein [Burkholderia sp. PAMC 26561]AME28235.1 hypothetical protein AXG89_30850 [Burkholderia sp. PAMC 26561]